tara:strand:+ start:522 stop:1085 length:564 start_codon:yes stop_codon:yes gene_type:complete
MYCTWRACAAGFLIAFCQYATGLDVGEQLPELLIPDRGQMVLLGKNIEYVPWRSTEIVSDKPAIFYYMPANIRSEGAFNVLHEELAKRGLSSSQNFESVTIVNIEQAVWGTSRLAYAAIENNKQENPSDIIVVDERGDAMTRWDLDLSEVALIIVDGRGRLSYLHKGRPLQTDVEIIAGKLHGLTAQ